jgi:hypothetical protein
VLDTAPRRRSSLAWDSHHFLSDDAVEASMDLESLGSGAFEMTAIEFGQAPSIPAPLAWAQLDVLSRLNRGWNSHGAPTLTLTAVRTAKRVAQLLAVSTTVPPAVVPTNRGGVQLEWHARGLDIEVEVDRAGAATVFVEDSAGTLDAEGSLSANWLVISKALRELQ